MFFSQVTPSFDASKVKVTGEGVRGQGVLTPVRVSFVVDTRNAGDADLDITITVSAIFLVIHNDNFTIDTEFRLSTDAFGSNQALLTRYVDNDNYYEFFVDKDTNVVFYVNSFGQSTQVRGGNVNALSNYHVAVSYEHNVQNLRLYVNNVLVDHSAFVANATPAGPIEIGNANALVSTLDATMNFMRFAKSARYRDDSIQPLVPTANYQATAISGAPLGSIDQGDKLSIRIFALLISLIS